MFDVLIGPVVVLCQNGRKGEVSKSIPTTSECNGDPVMFLSEGGNMLQIEEYGFSICCFGAGYKEIDPHNDRNSDYYDAKYDQKKLLVTQNLRPFCC